MKYNRLCGWQKLNWGKRENNTLELEQPKATLNGLTLGEEREEGKVMRTWHTG